MLIKDFLFLFLGGVADGGTSGGVEVTIEGGSIWGEGGRGRRRGGGVRGGRGLCLGERCGAHRGRGGPRR